MRKQISSTLLLILSALWLLGSTHLALSADKVKFDTADKVELQGTYYPSTKGKKAPTVLLVHKIGGSSAEEGWDKLATALQKEGFAVLSFDLRGHGNSKNLSDANVFWSVKSNQTLVRGFNPNVAKQTEKIELKSFSANYASWLTNDLAAAKHFLDTKKHDAEECNSFNTIVIAAEDACPLTMAWLQSDYRRHKLLGGTGFGAVPKPEKRPEGRDIINCIWLSYRSPNLGGKAMPINGWFSFHNHTSNETKLPMVFLHGDKDPAAEALAKAAFQYLKKDQKDAYSTALGIKDGGTLTGNKLLNANLVTEEKIVAYLKNFTEKYPLQAWDKREVKQAGFIWNIGGVISISKEPGDEATKLIPLSQLKLN